jgi:hypothetical protein
MLTGHQRVARRREAGVGLIVNPKGSYTQLSVTSWP